MTTDENLARLLEKSIEASNRTTHAVRAIARFVFIQLSFLTVAFLVWQLGLAFPDEQSCTVLGCQPHGVVSFFVVALLVIGVLASSSAAWYELSRSEVTQGFREDTTVAAKSDGAAVAPVKRGLKSRVLDYLDLKNF